MTSDYELQNLVEDKYQATFGQAVIVQVFNETTQKVIPNAAYSFVQGKLTLNGSAGAPRDK